METRAWLQAQCADDRPGMTEPMTVVLSDGPWTVATNGHRLAAVPGNLGYPDVGTRLPRLREILETLPACEPRAFSLDALRAFVGPWVVAGACTVCRGTQKVDCGRCDGTGEVECTCIDCDDQHDRDCEECDGLGTVTCPSCTTPAPERLRIGGALFTGENASALFAGAPGDSATWRQDDPEKPAYINGSGWRGILMPLREAGIARDVPGFTFDDALRGAVSAGSREA